MILSIHLSVKKFTLLVEMTGIWEYGLKVPFTLKYFNNSLNLNHKPNRNFWTSSRALHHHDVSTGDGLEPNSLNNSSYNLWQNDFTVGFSTESVETPVGNSVTNQFEKYRGAVYTKRSMFGCWRHGWKRTRFFTRRYAISGVFPGKPSIWFTGEKFDHQCRFDWKVEKTQEEYIEKL